MGFPTNHLWELIQSLSWSEIQKFKERAFQHKRGKYTIQILLFDAVKSQKRTYDEAAIKKKFRGESWVKHFARHKQALHDNILAYIREANATETSVLNGKLEDIQTLFAKRLFHHIPKRLEKAKELAQRMEAYSHLKKLLDYERELFKAWGNWGKIDELLAEEMDILERENERYRFKRLYDRLRAAHGMIGERRIDRLDEVAVTLDKIDKKGFRAVHSEIYRNQIRFDLHFLRGEYLEAIPYADRSIELYAERPALFSELLGFNNLCTLIYYAAAFRLMVNRYAEAEDKFRLLRELAKADVQEPVLYLETVTLFEVAIARKTFDFDRGHSAVENFYTSKGKSRMKIDHIAEMKIRHTAGVFYLNLGKPDLALKPIQENKAANLDKGRSDLVQFARVLLVVAHFELGDIGEAEKVIHAAKISLRRHNNSNPFYKAVFKMFGKLFRAKTKDESRNVLREFVGNFESGSPYWESSLNYFNFRAWANAMIRDVAMRETLKEEFQNQG